MDADTFKSRESKGLQFIFKGFNDKILTCTEMKHMQPELTD